jgi:hypothetical protein
VASLFYTTPTDDGAIAVTCDRCLTAVACPDPFAAATAITHHHCQPDTATADLQGCGPSANNERPPALHLLAGQWVASCPACGFQLASAASQARAERRSRRRTCPVCHEVA